MNKSAESSVFKLLALIEPSSRPFTRLLICSVVSLIVSTLSLEAADAVCAPLYLLDADSIAFCTFSEAVKSTSLVSSSTFASSESVSAAVIG